MDIWYPHGSFLVKNFGAILSYIFHMNYLLRVFKVLSMGYNPHQHIFTFLKASHVEEMPCFSVMASRVNSKVIFSSVVEVTTPSFHKPTSLHTGSH